jgi:hypothetical protein
LYASPSIITMIKWRMIEAKHVARVKDMRTAHEIVVGESVGDRPLRRCSHECVCNIKMGLKEIVWKTVGCIYLGPGRGRSRAVV